MFILVHGGIWSDLLLLLLYSIGWFDGSCRYLYIYPFGVPYGHLDSKGTFCLFLLLCFRVPPSFSLHVLSIFLDLVYF